MKRERLALDTEIKTIIIGLGNTLRRDDGIGVAIVETLKESSRLPEQITVIDAGTSDLEALLLMQGYQRVFLIDAADFGGEPGDWRCISLDDISFIPDVLTKYGSFHNAGLRDAIALGQTLEILPKEIFIYAIQPQDTQVSVGLSKPNSVAVGEIMEDLLLRLGREQNLDRSSIDTKAEE